MMHKMKKYEVGKDEQAKLKRFEGILKQLTPSNFEEVFGKVKAMNIDNAGTLRGVVAQIYYKALMEPTLCEMCANLCFYLSGELPDFSEDNEKITFKRLFLNKCQMEFERSERKKEEEANKADEESRIKARRRKLGNIRLIGELYKKKMLTERIMHECIKKLLEGQDQTPDEEDVEALCELVSSIGEIIDHPKAKKYVDAYFDSMETFSNNMTLSSRIRFMLKNTIDLRKNKWQPIRRVKVGETGDQEEAKQRQLRAILNKLTPTKFSKLVKQVTMYVDMDNAKTLLGLVGQIVDRAPMEPTFSELYASFCCHLSVELPRFSAENESISFKRLLAIKCQKEFEKGEEANKVGEEEIEIKQCKEEREAKIIKARRRRLGHIKFVGELYKKSLLTERIMHHCIRKLLPQHQTPPHEENLEALCILISTIGDQPKSKALVDEYVEKMETLSNNTELTSRIRFMLKDAIELRENHWQRRTRIEGPKKIEEIHYHVAQSRRQGCGPGNNLSRRWEASKDHFTRGSAVLSSPSSQLGRRNVHFVVGQPFEATTLTAPSTKRSVCGDATTSLSQDGVSRVAPFSSLADIPTKDLIPRMWLQELQEKSKAAIKEFYSARDVEEVTQCIKELNSPSFHPTMVYIWITDSFEEKGVERDLLAKLLVTLTKFHADTLNRSQLIKGLESVLVTLENTIIDVPKAPEYLGQILAIIIKANVASLGEIGQLIHNGGEEPGSLVNTGIAADVLGNILMSIRENCFGEIISNSNLHLETFLPPSPLKSKILERFIEDW